MANMTFEQAARDIVEMGRFASQRGWVEATSGNLSCRLDADRAAVTASGIDKGDLTPAHVLEAEVNAAPPPGSSAETPLHLRLYAEDPEIGAVLHTHSRPATLLSLRHQAQGGLVLEGYEMLKALAGIKTHEIRVTVPIFANDQDVPALSERVARRLAQDGKAVPGYLLAGHGLYAWGRTMAEAKRHLVALEYLFSCELERLRLAP